MQYRILQRNLTKALDLCTKCNEVITLAKQAHKYIQDRRYPQALKVCVDVTSVCHSVGNSPFFRAPLCLLIHVRGSQSGFDGVCDLTQTLDGLKSVHLPRYSKYEFAERLGRNEARGTRDIARKHVEAICNRVCVLLCCNSSRHTEQQLPLMLVKIKDSVKSEFSDWLSRYIAAFAPS